MTEPTDPSLRSKFGAFYTPPELASQLAREALANYFGDDFTEDDLNSVKIVDSSCGNGSLLG